MFLEDAAESKAQKYRAMLRWHMRVELCPIGRNGRLLGQSPEHQMGGDQRKSKTVNVSLGERTSGEWHHAPISYLEQHLDYGGTVRIKLKNLKGLKLRKLMPPTAH